VTADRGTVAVRAKDNVGHWSDWNYARIDGFVAAPEEPSLVPGRPTSPVLVPGVPGATPVIPAPEKAPIAGTPSASPSSQIPLAPKAPVTGVKVKAVLKGSSANVTVNVPSSLARTCTKKTVKGKKVSVCKAASIVVSVSRGVTKTYSAKSGNNAFKVPAKKGATVTIKVGGKIIQRIKL
jgi:hypothetical protein